MDATLGLPILVGLIAVALLFDFLNGLHDAANSIATIVSTRVLRPQYAVLWAAFFNFIAFLFFGLSVAATVGKGWCGAQRAPCRSRSWPLASSYGPSRLAVRPDSSRSCRGGERPCYTG